METLHDQYEALEISDYHDNDEPLTVVIWSKGQTKYCKTLEEAKERIEIAKTKRGNTVHLANGLYATTEKINVTHTYMIKHRKVTDWEVVNVE